MQRPTRSPSERDTAPDLAGARLRALTTTELAPADLVGLRALLDAAFRSDEDPVFPESDWLHALGGRHFLLELHGAIVAHASVVGRELHAAGRALRTGYVEAVATAPEVQGRGLGSIVMRAAGAHILQTYELGALGTGEHGFYARLGWRTWQGPTFVRTPTGEERTQDEDGGIMVLLTPASDGLDLGGPLSCDWREGDVW